MDKKEELGKRTIALLEKTRKCMYKYTKQRQILDKYLIEASNLEEWEEYIVEFENQIKNEEE